MDLLRQAVERAPSWARAHAGLADAYAVSGFYDYLPPKEAFPEAERAARRALELDPGLGAPHATLGYVHLYYEWRWDAADEEFRRAIELDPAYSTAHQWYGNYLTAMGRFPEAIEHMREAQERDPLSLIANAALGWSLYYSRDYQGAIAQFHRTLELYPDFEMAHLWQSQALAEVGELDAATREIEEAVRLSKGTPLTRAALAHVLATAGRRYSARAVIAGLVKGEGYVPSFEIAKAYLVLDDRAEGDGVAGAGLRGAGALHGVSRGGSSAGRAEGVSSVRGAAAKGGTVKGERPRGALSGRHRARHACAGRPPAAHGVAALTRPPIAPLGRSPADIPTRHTFPKSRLE